LRAVVSKRGVDDGNQKGGGFPQPAQESQIYYISLISQQSSFFRAFNFLIISWLEKSLKNCVNVMIFSGKLFYFPADVLWIKF